MKQSRSVYFAYFAILAAAFTLFTYCYGEIRFAAGKKEGKAIWKSAQEKMQQDCTRTLANQDYQHRIQRIGDEKDRYTIYKLMFDIREAMKEMRCK